MLRTNGTQHAAQQQLHKVVGIIEAGEIKLYRRAYYVTHLAPGLVVDVDGRYYRVYEDGRSGLHYWNVDAEVARALGREVEVIRLEVKA